MEHTKLKKYKTPLKWGMFALTLVFIGLTYLLILFWDVALDKEAADNGEVRERMVDFNIKDLFK